jgi:hypothetical protein
MQLDRLKGARVDRLLESYRLDKTVVKPFTLNDEGDDRAYWQSQSPQARLRALEFMRRVMYGDRATARLQRVLKVFEREPS